MTSPMARLWDETVRDFSALGSFQILLLLGLAVCPINLSVGVTVIGGLCAVDVFGALLKLVVHRARPDGQTFTGLIERVDAGSFPSVHAARSLVVALTLSASYPVLAPVVLPSCLLVGVSRVLLRRHRPTDVVAGYALGLAVGLITTMSWGGLPVH